VATNDVWRRRIFVPSKSHLRTRRQGLRKRSLSSCASARYVYRKLGRNRNRGSGPRGFNPTRTTMTTRTTTTHPVPIHRPPHWRRNDVEERSTNGKILSNGEKIGQGKDNSLGVLLNLTRGNVYVLPVITITNACATITLTSILYSPHVGA